MATFAPSAQHPMICEHNHELLNSGDDNVIEGICGESFETDDGLPSFEDCLLPNNSNANNVRTQECFFCSYDNFSCIRVCQNRVILLS